MEINQNDPVIQFLSGVNPEYKHLDFNMRILGSYIKFLWSVISPKDNILNMGIMKKTPDCLYETTLIKDVKSIIHIELDTPHKVKISSKENIVWRTDFVKYVLGCDDNFFDGVVCWHGPEHLTRPSGEKAIEGSMRVARRWVLISCPWDRLKGWKQEPKGKEHLGHKSIWNENDFLKHGFRVMTNGERGVYPGIILAWRIK
jgi:hypothetical protein